MWDLFVSYCNADGLKLARRVKVTLEKELSLRVFVSKYDGEQYRSYDDRLKHALKESSRFLLLWTPRANDSPHVHGEIALAAKLKKEIIAYRAAGSPEWPIAVGNIAPGRDENGLLRKLLSMDWRMEVIVPASGRSSGIYPLSEAMPKILLPVDDQPILHHILETLKGGPWSRIRVLAGRFENMMRHYVEWAKSSLKLEFDCVIEETQRDTLSEALLTLKPKRPFLLYFSDILTYRKPDWNSFVRAHLANRATHNVLGTLMQSEKYRLNVGRISPQIKHPELIKRFEEKPEDTGQHKINMAVSIFEPDILRHLHPGDQSLYGDTLPRAIKKGAQFAHYGYEGGWAHIQTLNDWKHAQKEHRPPGSGVPRQD